MERVSHRFEDGTVTLVIGRTGSGKSTLLHVLAGLADPDEGSVRMESPLPAGMRNSRQTGNLRAELVFQYPEQQLFARTVQGEFDYSLRALGLSIEAAAERVRQAIRAVGLEEEVLGRSPLLLSGGEKRKVALATALATSPDWLLLDEPTAALDSGSVRWLTDYLQTYRGRDCGGVIIVTHDLDTFLPIADRVVILQSGHKAADLSPGQLFAAPHILRNAQVGWPESMKLATTLADRGIVVAEGPLTPKEMAEAIIANLPGKQPGERAAGKQPGATRDAGNRGTVGRTTGSGPSDGRAAGNLPAAECSADQRAAGESAAEIRPAAEPAAFAGRPQLDPRAKWLVYMLLSAGILMQDGWLGLVFSLAVTAFAVKQTGVAVTRLIRMTKPFIWFTLLSVLISGLHISPDGRPLYEWIGFRPEPAAETFGQLVKFFLVMILGLAFILSTPQLMVKAALEKSFSFLQRLNISIGPLVLGTSLLLRFIPLIEREVERFGLIVRARGKSAARRGSVALRDMPAFVIPLLLSVLKTADDLALAMEIRGYRSKTMRYPASATDLRMNRRDVAVIAFGVALFCSLVLARRLGG